MKLQVPQNLDLPLSWIQDLLSLADFVLSPRISRVGKLKPKGGSQAYLAKLG